MKGRVISAVPQLDVMPPSPFCPNCGLPRDYEHFDESGFAETPAPGREVLLARFELPPQYCGRLENFSQFTDLLGRDLGEAQFTDLLGRHFVQVETPGLQWIITVNNRPLYPYINLDHIVNPWGWGSFGVSIRLDENATVEFVVRNLDYSPPTGSEIKRIGGRIVGRFWYNPAYGDATPHACRFK
jgi:hypothetical protein